MRAALLCFAAALPLAAQPAKLANAKLDTRPASGGLEAAFRPLVTAQPQPAWVGYMVPASRNRQFGCNSYSRDGELTAGGGTVYLEPPDHVLVLYRIDQNRIDRIRTLAPQCDIDAGGAPVHWLNDVKPAESVALLASLASAADHENNGAMNAIGMHADPSALAFFKKVLATDPADRPRERAIQALAMSRDAAALELVIAAAKSDRSPRVRGQALQWLSREAGAKAVGPIRQAIENDPEREVKRRAVSALQQMPGGEGVPLLIEIAKTSRDPEVRRQAMNSLGQSRDQRAVVFFEQVLKQ